MDHLLTCSECGKTTARLEAWRCPDCQSPLETAPIPTTASLSPWGEEASQWRYAAWLPPVAAAARTSLGEGLTPLIEGLLCPMARPGEAAYSARIHWKLDFLQPTGSFKDRGASLLVSHLKELGITRVRDDSSGNAGVSLAAYAARAGMACDIYVPVGTSAGKLAQLERFGANVHRIPGPRQAAREAAESPDAPGYYASHNWHPFFVEGMKTLGFEFWEQAGPPDNVIVPVGHGSLLLGLHRAFEALRRAGRLEQTPRLFAVQAAGDAPLCRALEAGAERIGAAHLHREGSTVAEGVAGCTPVRDRELISALKRIKGSCVTVTDGELARALRDLLAQGLYVEPTAAVGAAGARLLLEKGVILASEKTVVILTGSGLKTEAKIAELLGGD